MQNPRSPMRLRRLILSALLAVLVAAALAPAALAQQVTTRADLPAFLFDPTYYSTRSAEKKAVLDGNRVALTFFNSGLLGGVGEVRGNWPKGGDNSYIGDVLPVVGVEFPVDLNGDGRADTLLVNVVTVRGPRAGITEQGPPGQSGVFWGFEAKPGFAADQFADPACRQRHGGVLNDRPALSTDPCTWPAFWPDEPTWTSPATGRANWNGYFGRDQFNADLETYFWLDDTNNGEPQRLAQQVGGSFRADSLRPDMQGLGLAMSVRGMQWSQFLAQDAMFWLYEVTNTSTTTYPRVAVGFTVGACAGETRSGDPTCQQDLAFFDQGNRFVYSWDHDGVSATGQPIGYVGFAFLETPGDPNNGIDDDGDGDPFTEQGRDVDGIPFVNPPELAGANNVFTSADFEPRTLRIGDPIVIIDYDTFERRIEYLGEEPIHIETPRGTLTAAPGMTVQETQVTIQGQLEQITVTEKNLVDENFNGLIDEDINLHFERRYQQLDGSVAVLPPLRYKDWVGFANALVTRRGPNREVLETRLATRQDSMRYGLLNPMIDERRDDGIDNDGDWNPITDDVGEDGIPGTGAPGEGDGVPTPGEPNFDATDVNESDQIGLSSFFYFAPPGAVRMNQDRDLWRALTPGFFTTNEELRAQQGQGGIDGDFIFGSGYFRMPPGRTLRFTLAVVFGEDLEAITHNSRTVQEIYDRNYQFAKPPIRPTLNAVPGDGRVTLFWDSASLDTVDPVLGEDFQGYRIFKSTDPFFRDPDHVTDVRGRSAFPVPTWQFDLANGIRGIYTSSDPRTRGVPFPLGEDTGVRFSLVDSLVNNGQRYYYAITAYDHGSPDFYPAENNFAVSVREDGTVVTGANVVEVIPNAPVAGHQSATISGLVQRVRGGASGAVVADVLDPSMVPEGAAYRVTFGGGTFTRADSFFVSNDAGVLLGGGRIDRAESYVFDGVLLKMTNVEPRLKEFGYAQGGQSADRLDALLPRINQIGWRLDGTAVGFDYEIRFSDDPSGESLGGFRVGEGNNAPLAVARPVNFTVHNLTLGRPAPFVLVEGRTSQNGFFEPGDLIFIYDRLDPNSEDLTLTYAVRYASGFTGARPGSGDVFALQTFKPFSQRDEFQFGAQPAHAGVVDDEALARIRVVPNPYVAAAAWERPLPPTIQSGRGERRIDFIRLPQNAHVRVYTVRGALVWEGRHDGDLEDGTVSWDLRSREGQDVAYGVYFWHVQSPVGERTGKLALIK